MEKVDCSTTPVITTVHSDIINTHILPKLDGPTLASSGCASSELHSLCSEENLWKNICDSTWPSTTDPLVQDIISSFPSGHRSFFADSFPALDYHQQPKSKNRKTSAAGSIKPELLSAVDIHVGDQLLYSKVLVKEDMPGWYTNSFLRLDLLEGYEKVTKPVIKVNGEETQESDDCIKFLEEKMKMSCIMIDPTRKRALNLSSQAPVKVQKHWMSKDYIEVHYGMVTATAGVEGGFARFVVTVICERKKKGGELEMIQLSMKVEDLEGKMMNGKDSLVILHEAMDRRRAKRGTDEEKERFKNFLEMRGVYRENKDKRTKISDMVWIAICYTMLTAFCTLIIYSFLFSCACVRVGSLVRQLLFKRPLNDGGSDNL